MIKTFLVSKKKKNLKLKLPSTEFGALISKNYKINAHHTQHASPSNHVAKNSY